MKQHCSQPFSWESFHQMPVVGIIRNFSKAQVERIISIFLTAGFSTVEITMNTTGAREIIQNLTISYRNRLNVGAGTVCNLTDLDMALEAGAQFIVTPFIDEQVIKRCVALDVPIFPGALSPTETYKASLWGADAVKLFPASLLGENYLKELAGPMPHVKLLPTGGIGMHNCERFLKSGAVGLGMGGQLFDQELIEKHSWEALLVHFSTIVEKIRLCLNQS